MKEKGIDIDPVVNELPAEVQVIGIDESRIVALPGEIFVEFGLDIQRKSPFEKTFVIALANGWIPGYVCTKESYLQGSYEAGTSLLTEKAGERIVDTALKLLEETR